MMSKVKYRLIKKEDYKSISKLIEEAFHLSDLISDKSLLTIFTKKYLYDCLSEATYIEVAELNNQVVGVIMGKADSKYSYLKHSNYYAQVMMQQFKIFLHPSKKELSSYNDLLTIYDEFYEKHKEKFDGVLTLFAVNETCRGYGIGKQLLKDLMSYLEESQVKRIYLFTDSTCNYGFYEYHDFNRLEEKPITFNTSDQPKTMSVYFYERLLTSYS